MSGPGPKRSTGVTGFPSRGGAWAVVLFEGLVVSLVIVLFSLGVHSVLAYLLASIGAGVVIAVFLAGSRIRRRLPDGSTASGEAEVPLALADHAGSKEGRGRGPTSGSA